MLYLKKVHERGYALDLGSARKFSSSYCQDIQSGSQ